MNKMKRFIMVFAAAAVFVSVVSSCSEKTKDQTVSEAAISFIDDDGELIELDAPAEHIISMYSAHTENLYYLGADDKMIGGYKTCIYPPEAAFLDMYDYNSDPEKVIAADPDVVIIRPFISRNSPDFVNALKKAGLCVVSLYPESFDDFDDYIYKLAKISGTEENAEKILDEFHKEINSISVLTASAEDKPTVFFESVETNIRTVTDDSMAGRCISFAGGINIAADAESSGDGVTIADFGVEKILENADNIDVYISQHGSMNSGGSVEAISERPGFDTIKAIKEGRVYIIDEKLVSSPSFRYAKGVKEMARYIYPELMDDYSDLANDDIATRSTLARLIVMHRHLPVYIPSSSLYYKSEHEGHTFGMFKDVSWSNDDFDYIETAVNKGVIDWYDTEDGEYFYPENKVTREELAKAVFILGDYKSNGIGTEISDLDKCNNSRIVQTLVDNGVFELNNGAFEPEREVTNNEIIAALNTL